MLSGQTYVVQRPRGERGAASVELVVIAPVLMLTLLLLVQWAVKAHGDRVVEAAAREAAVDAAAWHGTTSDGRATGIEYLDDVGTSLEARSVRVSLGGRTATATVRARVVTLLPGFPVEVTATATVPRERFAE